MPNVAAVRLTYNPRVLWFDPNGIEFSAGDALIVKTERGLEYGVADENLKEVSEDAIAKLKSPLKPVMRKATSEDSAKWANLQAQAEEALPVFKEMVEQYKLDMHPVTVEFLFDGDKAIFYFEADERIDFRELVRALAAKFHVRIDMRQIGVRDEARIVGGFGHCGQELCCARLGGQFNPVSIRMAKDQDLSLNPQKISGLCGRLMCCLRYESDTYKEFKCHCPKQGSMVKVPGGEAKVVEINVPRETVTLQVEDKRVRVPVAEMGVDKKSGKPNSVSADVLEAAINAANPNMQVAEIVDRSIFTGTDKLAEAPVARHSESSRKSRKAEADEEQGRSSRRRRRSRGASSHTPVEEKRDSQRKQRSCGEAAGGEDQQKQSQGRVKRRRSQTAQVRNAAMARLLRMHSLSVPPISRSSRKTAARHKSKISPNSNVAPGSVPRACLRRRLKARSGPRQAKPRRIGVPVVARIKRRAARARTASNNPKWDRNELLSHFLKGASR